MLSECIRKVRQKALFSQTAFAKELGVAYSTINRWETGKSKPNLSAMRAIKVFCEKNNISYSEIEREWLEYSQEGK